MKGIFIVLEGIDGCGKSTQIKHLVNWLPISGLMPKGSQLLSTREPGGTAIGNSIRQLLLNNDYNQPPKSTTELLLYAADRAQHINEIISPAIKRGDWIISDRFSASTLAYQGFGRNLDIELIKTLEIIATQGIIPNITFLLDISVNESIKRRKNRQVDRIESEGENFLERVSKGFSYIAREQRWTIIDAEQDINIVSKEIEKNLIRTLDKSLQRN